ncbi:hypothetical protein L1987_18137 [Smallanthus sonchifolius]|uniref:Uncharacterized protein n=1 Tax=Smallanthus sonchifolius TaxID=185202 RepID=A0ACB9J0X8_9ASTR|nr:hypothetical protein L1987_18137 [Smallanthus sonchifolius]
MLSEVFTADETLLSGSAFFKTGGFTPRDTQQNPVLDLLFPPHDQEPVFSFSSSANSTPKTLGPEEFEAMEERKRRRMITNRESARRSRMRKQMHLENLRSQLNRLKAGNRDLMNRLRVVNLHGKLLRQENQRLVSESVMFQQKLRDIRHALHLRQLNHQLLTSAWPCNNNVTYIYEQNPPSLIT